MPVTIATGLSGVGKTTATRIAADCDYYTASVGDVVRREYRTSGEDAESIGEFNTRMHAECGRDHFVRGAVETLRRHGVGDGADVVVDGVHTTEAFGRATLVWIHAPVGDRLRRVRRRDGESVTERDLLRRDLRELRYGLADFATPFGHDARLDNDAGIERFEADVRALLRNEG
jgi:dephospho-CoA kinase